MSCGRPRSRPRPRSTAVVAGVLGGVAALGGAAFFGVLPRLLERRLNGVTEARLPPVEPDARRLHESLTVVDLHSDALLWHRDLLRRVDRGHVDLPRLEAGNVALQVFSSVTKTPKGQNFDENAADTDRITLLSVAQLRPPRTWTSLLQRSLHHAACLESAAARSGGRLALVRTAEDLEQLLVARASGRRVTGALFSVEGLHNLQGRLESLDLLEAAGMRMAGLTHFFDNEVAGSMHGLAKTGLTAFGREVLTELERRRIVVDVAHASHTTVSEVLSAATRPVVSSHGGVQATCEVNRNLTDEEIRGIAATGGIVGIGYWEAAVGAPTPAAVVDALEHVMAVGGVGAAALGSDYDGAVTVGWDTSEVSQVTAELLRRGHAEPDIAAVMGGNAVRVLRETLPPA